MKATHYIAQFQRSLNQQTLRAELYYKKYDNLVKTGVVGFTEAAINNNGFGDAKGFELFWRDKKTIKNFDYWISYSFLDTERDFLNFPFAITPNFAAKHTGNVQHSGDNHRPSATRSGSGPNELHNGPSSFQVSNYH